MNSNLWKQGEGAWRKSIRRHKKMNASMKAAIIGFLLIAALIAVPVAADSSSVTQINNANVIGSFTTVIVQTNINTAGPTYVKYQVGVNSLGQINNGNIGFSGVTKVIQTNINTYTWTLHK
jgi:hypothetical protein